MQLKGLCRWLEALDIRYVVFFLLALGFIVRLVAVTVLKSHPTVHFQEMERVARTLATNGTFANPYKIPTGPTAHLAPVYPVLLSFIFRMFGYGALAAYATYTMNFFFAALQYALLPVLTDAAKIHRIVGVTAGLFGAVLPYRILRELTWEETLSALTIVCLMLITTRWWQAPRPSRLSTFLMGLAWGAGMLCCPTILPVFLLILLSFALAAWKGKQSQWQITVFIAVLGMAVAVAPWIVRNERALGGFVFVRDNFGLELGISNNPEAHALFLDNLSIGFPHNYYHLHHPEENLESAEQVRQWGEIEFNRQRLHQAVSWIRGDTRKFLKLTFERAAFFWFTPTKRQIVKSVLLVPWTLLAAFGLWHALHRHRPLGILLLCLWMGFPLVYYLVQADTRYRYPMDWSFALLAVYVLTKPLWDAPVSQPGGVDVADQ